MSGLRPRRKPSATLDDLEGAADGLHLHTPGGPPSAAVRGVTLDSRSVEPGDLYAALPGAHVHGARFIPQAVAAGAVAVLTDPDGLAAVTALDEPVPALVADDPRSVLGALSAQVYGRPGEALNLVGVTGTNGKTTVAYLLDAAWRALGRVTGLVGTIETRVADERVPSVRTTPESPDVHALLALMQERGVQDCVMEVSSHALSLHRVDALVYDTAVFTNLSQDHLDFHHTMEAYFAAKASLFTPQRSRRGVVCVDDAWGARLAREATVPVTTLATRPDAAGAASAHWHLTPGDGGDGFTLSGPTHTLHLTSSLPGAHNRINTALAALVLLLEGFTPAQVSTALAAGTKVPGRMQRVDLGPGAPAAYVDFAHTPDAVTATLSALAGRAGGRLVAVLGAGGDRDPGKRAAMGAAAARAATHVVVTDDNPRHEDPAAIRAAIVGGAQGAGGQVHEVAGRAAGIAAALRLAGAGGLVAVLGKGHEQGQTIGETTHPFDDAHALAQAWSAHDDSTERKAAAVNDPGTPDAEPMTEGRA